MPFPAAAAIAGGAQMVGASIDAISTGIQNRKSRDFSRKMYDLQKRDNLEFWNTQNAYNSPEQQMSRFKQAGLNPNLIYGQGNSGNAGSIATPDVQKPEFRVPEFGNAISQAGTTIGNYMDYEIKQAQVDNLRAQNTTLLEEAMLKHAQRENTVSQTKRSVFDLNRDSTMLDTYYDAQRENLRKLKSESDVMLARNEREAAMNASNVKEAAERILNMRGQRLDTARAAELKRLDIKLKGMGIQPSDPIYMRFLAQYLGKDAIMKGGGSMIDKLDSWGLFRKR